MVWLFWGEVCFYFSNQWAEVCCVNDSKWVQKPLQDNGIMTTTVTGMFCTCPPLGTVPRCLHSWRNATSAVSAFDRMLFCLPVLSAGAWRVIIIHVSASAHTWVSLDSRCVNITYTRYSLIVFSSLGSVLNHSIKRCSLGFSKHWLLMRFDSWLWSGTSLVMDMLVIDVEGGSFKQPLYPVCVISLRP